MLDHAGREVLGLGTDRLIRGVMPFRALPDAGAVVGLGTDGSCCGHRQDLFENSKLMVLMHRLHNLDPEACLAAEALGVATRGGAAAHGIQAGARPSGGGLKNFKPYPRLRDRGWGGVPLPES